MANITTLHTVYQKNDSGDDGAHNLAAAILETAVTDYKKLITRQLSTTDIPTVTFQEQICIIEQFFQSEFCSVWCPVDPTKLSSQVISQVRQQFPSDWSETTERLCLKTYANYKTLLERQLANPGSAKCQKDIFLADAFFFSEWFLSISPAPPEDMLVDFHCRLAAHTPNWERVSKDLVWKTNHSLELNMAILQRRPENKATQSKVRHLNQFLKTEWFTWLTSQC